MKVKTNWLASWLLKSREVACISVGPVTSCDFWIHLIGLSSATSRPGTRDFVKTQPSLKYLYTEEEEEEEKRERIRQAQRAESIQRGEGGRDGESALRTTTETQQRASLFNF